MGNTVQPGTEVDEATWQQFREEVERRRGGTRGHIRNELERALTAYIQGGDATPAEIDARLQRIEAAVGAAPTDGGEAATAPQSADTHTDIEQTQTQPAEIDEKPDPKSTRDRKIAYLAGCIQEYTCDDFETISEDDIIEIIRDEYGFRADTTKTYLEDLIDHFELVDHPLMEDTPLLVTEKKRDAILGAEAEKELSRHSESDPA
jgi:hypothetical protein